MTVTPAMTVSEALGALPDYVLEQLGERAFEKCLNRAGLASFIMSQAGGYVPEISINRFLHQAAREAGDELFGAHVSRIFSVRDYGIWGDYVLAAPSLAVAFDRAIQTIGLHASVDKLGLAVGKRISRFSYRFGERSHIGYCQVACAAVGSMLSVPRHYLGPDWTPVSIGLDLPMPRYHSSVEEAFGFPVRFGANAIEVDLLTADLACRNPARGDESITVADVRREIGGPPKKYTEIVAMTQRQNFGLERITIDQVARSLAISVRSLQRGLETEGSTFRDIITNTKICHAAELLQQGDGNWSPAKIAAYLDYSTPSHFGRAFAAKIGMPPTVFAKKYLHS